MRIRIAVTFALVLGHALSSTAIASDLAERLIRRGDRYYDNRGKGPQWSAKAFQSYEKALAVDPNSVEASWKLGRVSHWIGQHTESDKEKLRIYKCAISLLKRAAALDDESPECHFWLALHYGNYGKTKGIMSSLALVEPMKKELQRVLQIDETWGGGAAHCVMGRLYNLLPGIAGGSNEKSIEHFEKAIAIDENRLINRLYASMVYLDEDRVDVARKHLKFIVDAPFEAGRRPENVEEKEIARRMLEELDSAS